MRRCRQRESAAYADTDNAHTLRTHRAGVLGEYEFISFNLQQQQQQLLLPELDLVKIKVKLRTHDIFQQCKATLKEIAEFLIMQILIWYNIFKFTLWYIILKCIYIPNIPISYPY